MRRHTPAAERVVALVTGDGRRHAVTQTREPRGSYGEQFVILFTQSMQEVAMRIQSGPTLRVLLVLPQHLDFVTFKLLPREKLATLLKISGAAASTALTELNALGVIERQGRGPVTKWRLSADIGWNGNVDAWHAHQRRRRTKQAEQEPEATPEPTIVAEDIDTKRNSETRSATNKAQTQLRLLTPISQRNI